MGSLQVVEQQTQFVFDLKYLSPFDEFEPLARSFAKQLTNAGMSVRLNEPYSVRLQLIDATLYLAYYHLYSVLKVILHEK
mgnify:CR=1